MPGREEEPRVPHPAQQDRIARDGGLGPVEQRLGVADEIEIEVKVLRR